MSTPVSHQPLRRSTVAFLVVAFTAVGVLAAAPSDALEACKAKISAKDGTILVSAKAVSGTLEWGNAAGQAVNSFANTATCVVDGTANKCALGAPGSAQRITPPALCTIFLADAGGTCSAFLKGCTPGIRTADVGGGFVAKSGDVMTGPLRAVTIDTLIGVDGCDVGDVCAFSRLVSNLGAEIGGSLDIGGGIHQPAASNGAVKAGLIVDCQGTGASIVRAFNTTASGGSFTAAGAGGAGACTVTTPFAIGSRFFAATGLDTNKAVLVTLAPTGSNGIEIRRSRENVGVLNGDDGLVSIQIY